MKNVEQRMPSIGSNESTEQMGKINKSAASTYHEQESKFWWLVALNQLVRNHLLDLIIFVFCIALGAIIASHFYNSNKNELPTGVLASSSILLNKGIRGICPPLSGRYEDLIGTWRIRLVTAPQRSSTGFHNYSLTFKPNSEIELTHKNCKGDIKLKWAVFSYNIYMQEVKNDSQQELYIPNEEEDIACIKSNGEFFNLLTNVSIWTVYNFQLYLVSEVNALNKIHAYLLILSK